MDHDHTALNNRAPELTIDDPPPADRTAAEEAHARIQSRDALRLVKQVRDVTGAQLRVYRLNSADYVAALTRERAISWYAENSETLMDPPIHELGLWSVIPAEDGERHVWFLIADHFRKVLEVWTPGTPLPKELHSPFLIARVRQTPEEGGAE
jgi:hypothetical protein